MRKREKGKGAHLVFLETGAGGNDEEELDHELSFERRGRLGRVEVELLNLPHNLSRVQSIGWRVHECLGDGLQFEQNGAPSLSIARRRSNVAARAYEAASSRSISIRCSLLLSGSLHDLLLHLEIGDEGAECRELRVHILLDVLQIGIAQAALVSLDESRLFGHGRFVGGGRWRGLAAQSAQPLIAPEAAA